jgi:hypothetical protein
MSLRAFLATTVLAVMALAILFDSFVRSDPLGIVGWFVLVFLVIGGLVILGIASFLGRALVRSTRANRRMEREDHA